MEWYSGDISQCIKKVKCEKKLLLVLLQDSERVSNEVSATFDAADIIDQCRNLICLKLQTGSVPYEQFKSVYQVYSLPCIHIISPSGLVLAVKSTDFSKDTILLWLAENITSFENNHPGVAEESDKKADERQIDSFKEGSSIVGDRRGFQQLSEVVENNKKVLTEVDSFIASTESEASVLCSIPDDCTENSQCSRKSSNEEIQPVRNTHSASSKSPTSQSGSNLNERVEYARQLLEENRRVKVTKALHDTHESELRRRNLGRSMTEFKRRKQEQDIRELLEEQKREREENQAARQRILAQIEMDRRDRLAFVSKITEPINPSTIPNIATNSNEVRLQLRLPDGAYMIGVFSAKAHLGVEVRQYIISQVRATETSKTAVPLSDATRASFAKIISRGFTFRQIHPNQLRRFSSDDEISKTLQDLDLWPSAVLTLWCNQRKPDSNLEKYSYNPFSQLLNSLWSGVRGVGGVIFSLGHRLLQFGHGAFQTLFNFDSHRTIGQTQTTRHPASSDSLGDRETRNVCRRQASHQVVIFFTF